MSLENKLISLNKQSIIFSLNALFGLDGLQILERFELEPLHARSSFLFLFIPFLFFSLFLLATFTLYIHYTRD